MSEQSNQQPSTDIIQVSREEVGKLYNYLQGKHAGTIEYLRTIKEIKTDADRSGAEEILSISKQVYEKMYARRIAFTDPIKKFIAALMVFESDLNPAATKENEYLRARKQIEIYDQSKIKEKQVKEHEAWVRSEQIKYKAEFRAKVQEELALMLGSVERNVISAMAEWERTMTLEMLDEKAMKLQNQAPTLKRESYDKCFHRYGKRPDVMTGLTEDEYLIELKAELTYDIYNEKFQLIVAPIKNEYLAKVPLIRKRLQDIVSANAEHAEKLKKMQEDNLKAERDIALAASQKKESEEKQVIEDQKALGVMEGDFTAQGMMSDVVSGPSKQVYSFENDAMWLPAFLQVVSKCAVHPDFGSIVNAKGEYIPAIKKFMDFYSSKIGEPMKGLKSEEVAKTIIKKK